MEKKNNFSLNSVRNLFLLLVLVVLLIPLLIILYFAANYRDLAPKKQAQSDENKTSVSQTDTQNTTPTPTAKIVLLNSDPSQPELVSSPPTSQSSSQQTSSPPPAANPPPPPPPCPKEFTGTVVSVSGNQVTFSYGNSQSVAIQLTKTSPGTLSPGTVAHVHAKLQNNVCVEDEIEL